MHTMDKKFLFFSGGTAFNKTSAVLSRCTSNTTHIVTTFDSGGSTGFLRKAFPIPAVGDIRNRLLALTHAEKVGTSIIDLFSMRLSKKPSCSEKTLMHRLLLGENPLWSTITEEHAKELQTYTRYFLKAIPHNFSFSLGSIGNFILVGALLYHNTLCKAITSISKILHVQGTVLPVTEENLHLIAYTNTNILWGQKEITHTKLEAPLKDIFLINGISKNTKKIQKVNPAVSTEILQHIKEADYICYPMGSFYTSIIASLLPKDIGKAIAQSSAPKIYIPNSGIDTEQGTMTVAQCVNTLISTLQNEDFSRPTDYITHILLDSNTTLYPNGVEKEALTAFGIQVIFLENSIYNTEHIPHTLVQGLLSL